MSNFLYCGRSHFSIGEAIISPKDLVLAAKSAKAPCIAMADTMTISGMTEFLEECKKQEIKGLIGCRLRVVMDLDYRKPSRTELRVNNPNPEWFPKVFPKNKDGMTEIMKLLSLANEAERFYFYPRVSLEDLIDLLRGDNVLMLTGDLQSLFALHDKQYNHQLIIDKINSEITLKNVYFERLNAKSILFDTLNKKVARIANNEEFNIVSTNLVLYREKREADTLDVLSAIANNAKLSASYRNIQWIKDFYAKPTSLIKEELFNSADKTGFADKERLSSGLQSFLDSYQYEWEKMPVSLPKMADDEKSEIIKEVAKGWKKRVLSEVMGYKPDKELLSVYKERLAYELGIICKMKFERYFLMVQDLVRWSRENGIATGPGRGSAGGSLVSFLMGITDVDPIRFNLLFERFINPDRLDLPDIDLDFMASRRGEVIEYLVNKYGEDRVAGISNYAAMVSASALRDTGRVYGLTMEQLTPTRYVPKIQGTPFTLTEAAEAVPEINRFRKDFPDVWRHSLNLEGCMRALGKHAAGIVVADEPLVNRAVIETRSGSKVVNWDRSSVEDWGLVKIDVLGLATLDTLKIALDYIKQRTGEVVELLNLQLDDEKTLQWMSEGRTEGVFQLSSSAMGGILKKLAKENSVTFDDICATTALYRPGPLESGMLDAYILFRQGENYPKYIHESMKPALESTGGVMIYQEQTMQVARDVAGYSMADADKLRKIISKKQKAEMEKQRDKFINGCQETSGLSEASASEIFASIESNASYQFNLSHSVQYSVLSYWEMYLKAHHTPEFFAAKLTVVDDDDQMLSILNDAAKYEIYVTPPDINLSTSKFEITKSGDECHLMAPFTKLKGFSDKAQEEILKARAKAGGAFKSKKDLTSNIENKRRCTSRHVKTLETVGAFASIEEGSLPIRHPDRIKDQIELMPGLIIEFTKAERYTKLRDISLEASAIVRDVKGCNACSLSVCKHAIPSSGDTIKFMVITDNPNHSEIEAEKMMKGKACKTLESVVKEAGLKKSNGYYTALIKAEKDKEIKKFTNEQLTACSNILSREIKAVNPAVIVALGGSAIRHFYPDIKGSWSELCGRVIYNKELDANIVCGINPQMCYFREEAGEMLLDVFKKVKTMLS